jgi:hypothetical protein
MIASCYQHYPVTAPFDNKPTNKTPKQQQEQNYFFFKR